MKKILVTGGAGFIGSHFIKLALKQNPTLEVINLDLLTYAGNLENLTELKDNPRYTFVKGDIRDNLLTNKTAAQCEAIINFAAESHVDRSILGPEAFIQTNVVGTLNLLETARKLKIPRFIQVSTDEVYGSLPESGSFSEATPLAPNSPYSASKASADLLCRSYYHTFNQDVIITRCSNNYGPNQFPEKLIPLMINNAQNNKALPVYGDGQNVRDWIYVEDHCQAILRVLYSGKAGEVYNIGSDNEWPNIQIVKKIIQLLGKSEVLIKYVSDRPGHDRRYAINSNKIKTELNWQPTKSFENGLKQTVEWYLNNKAWLTNIQSGDYKSYYELQYGSKSNL